MDKKILEGLNVAIIATDDFELIELADPKKALEDAGARTTVLAPHSGTIQGFKHDVKADTVKVDMTLNEANPSQFDAVLLPGGALNADALRMDEKARAFVKEADRSGKPIAVICHGPWLLASAGLVKGRRMTSYHTIQDDLRNAGAQWEDSEVVRDRNWLSSRSPKDLPAFDREMISLFAEARVRAGKQFAA
jgi:protease I